LLQDGIGDAGKIALNYRGVLGSVQRRPGQVELFRDKQAPFVLVGAGQHGQAVEFTGAQSRVDRLRHDGAVDDRGLESGSLIGQYGGDRKLTQAGGGLVRAPRRRGEGRALRLAFGEGRQDKRVGTALERGTDSRRAALVTLRKRMNS
jgi:hypothetical protein